MNLGAWGSPSADPGAMCVLQDIRRAQPVGRWRGGWLGGRAAQQWAEAVLARGLQAWDTGVAPRAAPHSYPCVPCTKCRGSEADLGWNLQKEQKRGRSRLVFCWERWNSALRGTAANWQSLTTNGVSLWIPTAHGSQGKPQFIYDRMQHLVWSIYI